MKCIEPSVHRTALGRECFGGKRKLKFRIFQRASSRVSSAPNIGSSPLISETELLRVFPNRKLRIFIASWNMNSTMGPKNLGELLMTSSEHKADIYIIGTQEGANDKREWEIRLQQALLPSHVLFHSCHLGVLQLCVFVQRDLIWYCGSPQDTLQSTRAGSALKTKGAVCTAFSFFGTSMLFINSHLTAHENNQHNRIADYEKIMRTLFPPTVSQSKVSPRQPSKYDAIFWFGDLNFRLDTNSETVLKVLADRDYKALFKFDQLKHVITSGDAFSGFKEADIDFAPTFKYEVNSNMYDKNTIRVPSYTDRILYRSSEGQSLAVHLYDSIECFSTSDHKPVVGLFEIDLKASSNPTRLAAGAFRREVFIEALKRSSVRRKFSSDVGRPSAVCAVQ